MLRRSYGAVFAALLALLFLGVARPCLSATVLLVTDGSGTLTSNESSYKSYLESLGYTVTTVWDNASQATIDAAWAAANAVYVPFSVTDWELGDKLRLCTKGIVSEERYLDDNYGLSTQPGWDTSSYTTISITNNTHYITSPFSTGALTIFSSSQPMALMNPTHAAGLTTLAEQHFGNKALAIVEQGATLANTVSGNSTAAGRRVHLPWGGDSFNISALNSNAQAIGLRAIEWAIGNSLMLHYQLDASSGTTLTDVSGNNRHGAFNAGTPAWTTGRRKNALQFNGSNDADTNSNFDPPSTGTVAFWFRGNGTPAAVQRLLGITTNWEVTYKTDGTLGFDLGAGAGFSSATAFTTAGVWHHVVAIYNSTSDDYSVYIDGVLDSSGSVTLADQGAGILSVGTRTGMTDRFVGAIDDLRIYYDELTPSQIAEIYGLVGRWKLNNTSGTTATDSSLKALNGVYTNGPAVGQPGPYSGNGQYAASFDGANDYVNGAPSTNYTAFSDGFTISAWVYLNAHFNNAAILENGSTTDSCSVSLSGTGQLRVNGRSSGGLQTHTSTATLPLATWKHVVGTYDGTTFKAYIDGQLVSSGANSFTITTPAGNLTLGASRQGTDEHLNGKLHDVRLYNRAIAADEVAELYGLIGHWKLNETAGTTAVDSSGKSLNGTYTAGPVLAQSGPYPGAGQYAPLFDGADDCVSGSAAANYPCADGYSIAGWVYINAYVDNAAILENGSSTDSCSVALSSTGQVRVTGRSSGGSQTHTTTTTLALRKWTHVVGTHDGSTFRIYVDGKLNSSSNNAFTLISPSGSLTLGASLQSSDEFLNGRLHDVRLYNRAVSAKEVADIYGLIGHWMFDEGAGTSLAESSGTGAGAAFNNGSPDWVNGVYGSGLAFDGVSDDAITSSSFTPPSTGAVAYWFRSTGTPASQQRHFGLGGDWEGWQNPDGIVRFDLCGDANTGGFRTVSTPMKSGNWYHLVAMYDAADESYSIYINGVLDKSGTSTTALIPQSAAQLSFGTRTGATQRLAGSLDDFRVYNRKLSPWEVYQIYGLMAWYKLDETSGATATDSTGRGQTGTFSGSPTLNVSANGAASQGTAVAFNGMNAMQASGLYEKSASVSTAAWVRLDGVDSLGAEVVSIGDAFLLRLASGNSGALAKYYNGSSWITATASRTMLNAGWHHVAAVLESGSTLKVYVDGVEAASSATSGSISYSGLGANTRVASHGNGQSTYDLTGRVDDVRIYNRALKPDEVFQLYRGSRINGIKILQWVETR